MTRGKYHAIDGKHCKLWTADPQTLGERVILTDFSEITVMLKSKLPNAT